MKTIEPQLYEVTYQVKVIITANSEANAFAETRDILFNADRGVADFIVADVSKKSIITITEEM